MVDDELVDDLCWPCRYGRHRDCRWDLGCQCAVRWGAEGEPSVVLCESLAPLGVPLQRPSNDVAD